MNKPVLTEEQVKAIHHAIEIARNAPGRYNDQVIAQLESLLPESKSSSENQLSLPL